MSKKVFSDQSKSDFGYAVKIVLVLGILIGTLVYTLNVSKEFLWFGMAIFASSFIVNFFTDRSDLKTRCHLGNAFLLAVGIMAIMTLIPIYFWVKVSIAVFFGVLVNIYWVLIGSVLFLKNTEEITIDISNIMATNVVFIVIFFVCIFFRFLDNMADKKELARKEKQNADIEKADPNGVYTVFKDGETTFIVKKVVPVVMSGYTKVVLISEDNMLFTINRNLEEAVLTEPGHIVWVEVDEGGYCLDFDNQNIVVVK